jgi:hypothetical protein
MENPGPPDEAGKRAGIRAGIGLAAIVAVTLVAWLVSGCGGDSASDSTGSAEPEPTSPPAREASSRPTGESTSDSSPPIPERVTVDSLRKTAAKQKTPIYWAGERPGTKLALSPLTPGSLGRTFVRYLTGGAKADDPRPIFFTVITYIDANPVATMRAQAKETGDTVGKTPGGASIYYDHSQPENIYLAFPGVDAKIEVFYPGHFKQALQLANSGQIVPVG